MPPLASNHHAGYASGYGLSHTGYYAGGEPETYDEDTVGALQLASQHLSAMQSNADVRIDPMYRPQ
jgi:hypothetical protein